MDIFYSVFLRSVLKIFLMSDKENYRNHNKATGISLHRFEKVLSKEQYQVLCHTHYLINPNYEIKFGLHPRIVPKFLQVPYLQDFYTTAMYYVVKKH